jgi:hypothetical protein
MVVSSLPHAPCSAACAIAFVAKRTALAAPPEGHFITLLAGYRSQGGLPRLYTLQATQREAWGADIVNALPAHVADRTVLGITWNREAWVPGFQFDSHGAVAQPTAAVFAELKSSYDPWELATWFITPSTWLRQARPIDQLAAAPAHVVEAARADRYVANGG